MANLLANQFSSVYSKPDESLPSAESFFSDDDGSEFSSFLLSIKDFLDAIDKTKMNSGAGPDGLPAIFLKKCSLNVVKPLRLLWQKCFDEGKTPSALKYPIVFPLHKGGSKGFRVNYRPITSSSHIIKIFEKVISCKLYEYIEEKNHLNPPNQHGFRHGYSCLSELLSHYDEILSILESRGCADVVYLDFSNTFDKVDFGVLLSKLKQLGIGGKVGRWIYSFLTNRFQRVSVNGALSELFKVLSGVPQGSVLGPLLFLVMISDIDTSLIGRKSTLRSFADDSRVVSPVFSATDISEFQKDLCTVYDWAEANKMTFNDTKFEVMRYNISNVMLPDPIYYSPSGDQIAIKSSLSNLGVVMSHDCCFQAT